MTSTDLMPIMGAGSMANVHFRSIGNHLHVMWKCPCCSKEHELFKIACKCGPELGDDQCTICRYENKKEAEADERD
jgi:hypothetical protein